MTTSLLDETDRTRRLAQHGMILLGVVVLVLAARVVEQPGRLATGLAVIATGLLLFVLAALVKQRWSVSYKGHDIRFENNPFTGERLFVDGVQVAKGKIGMQSRMSDRSRRRGAAETLLRNLAERLHAFEIPQS